MLQDGRGCGTNWQHAMICPRDGSVPRLTYLLTAPSVLAMEASLTSASRLLLDPGNIPFGLLSTID